MRGRASVVKMLLDLGSDPNGIGKQGNAPLHNAAQKGRVDVAKLLLSHGADVNLRNNAGSTALHDAALEGHAAMGELLLANKAEIEAKDESLGATPLYYAVTLGREDAVKGLIAKGANVNTRNKKGMIILRAAMDNGAGSIAAVIRSHGGRE